MLRRLGRETVDFVRGRGGVFCFRFAFLFSGGKQVNCKKGYFVNYKGFLVRARPGTGTRRGNILFLSVFLSP